MVHHVLESLMGDRVGEVETVDARRLDPLLQNVRNGRGGPDEHGPHPTDSPPFREFVDGPGFVAPGEVLDCRNYGICLDPFDEISRRVLAEIDAGPAGHEDE